MDTKTNKVTNPHDKLFREIWSDPANVRNFLQHYLPADVLNIADLESLEICKDSFVEKETGLQHLETVLRYLFSTVETISTDKIKTIVAQSLSDKEGDFIMTLAEQLHKEGFEKGMQQGIREGLMEGIEMAISFKYPDKTNQIMSMIYEIKDTSQLKMVKDIIKTARNTSEIIALLKK